jgi:hypothetical protein
VCFCGGHRRDQGGGWDDNVRTIPVAFRPVDKKPGCASLRSKGECNKVKFHAISSTWGKGLVEALNGNGSDLVCEPCRKIVSAAIKVATDSGLKAGNKPHTKVVLKLLDIGGCDESDDDESDDDDQDGDEEGEARAVANMAFTAVEEARVLREKLKRATAYM